MRRVLAAMWVVVFLVMGAMLTAGPVAGGAGQTFHVTSPDLCGGTGTFEQAVKDANASSGKDTIEFDAGLRVDASSCGRLHQGPGQYPIVATQAVDVVGNGARIEGNQVWIDASGATNPVTACPLSSAGHVWAAQSKGFIAVGELGKDNSGVDVSISGLDFDNLPSLAAAYENASLTLADSQAKRINSFNNDCHLTAIAGTTGADITLRNVGISDSHAPGVGSGENDILGLIEGVDGDLVLDRVTLDSNVQGRAVSWHNSAGVATAKIVSSKILDSGGLRLDANTSQIVNTAFYTHGQTPANRITTSRGATTIKASTLYWMQPVCQPACGVNGIGLQVTGTGTFDLSSSAIGAVATFPNSGPLLFGDKARFTSDDTTWVQQTANQSNAALQTILPKVLTGMPGLKAIDFGQLWVDAVTPILGSAGTPGVLVDSVLDGACPGGANALLSPIDGSCITADVLGNPRWDAGNGKRNIGAVQNVQSPHMTLDPAASITATSVPLSWNRPLDPASGPITAYQIFCAPAAGGPLQTYYVSGPDSLKATIPGLTPGKPYVFNVVGVNRVGPGPRSNEVTATPVGMVGIPGVTATGGNHQVVVTWTEPDFAGNPGPALYSVYYRKLGDPFWINGPFDLAERATTIRGLENGVAYEFGVVAQVADGNVSPQLGVGSATPTPGAGASVFVPIDPARVYDSRLAGPGGTPDPIPGNHGSRVMSVADAIDVVTGRVLQRNVVPAGASAVAFNLTATETQSRGWFAITPGDASTYSASTVNWAGGSEVIANGLTVKLASDRTVKVFNGSDQATDAVLDIVGYFIDPSQAGQVFHEITPTRVYDSRTAGPWGTPDPLAGGADRVLSVADGLTPPSQDIVPAGATAVAYNISAVDTSARGWFAVTPGDAATYRSSTLNWAGAGDVIDNGQLVKLDANRQIKVFNGYGPPTNLVVEVLGYFTPSVGATDGTYFHALDPVRAYDSRAAQPDPGAVAGGSTRRVAIADGRDITTGAVTVADVIPVGTPSIVYSITATDTTSRGWFSVTPGDVSDQLTTSINWPDAGDVVANGLTGAVDGQRTINVRSGSPSQTNLVIDLYGYFK